MVCYSVARLLWVVALLGSLGVMRVLGDVPPNTTVGIFGPLAAFQPFDNWLYPSNTAIPLCISLGNASLAL
jgi:hypothetical protein